MTTRRFLRPGPGRLLLEPLPSSGQVDIGEGKILYVVSDNRDEAVIGKVIANHGSDYLDDGETRSPMYVPGQLVIIGKHTGTKISIDRRSFIVITESSVIAELTEVEDEPPSQPPT